MKRFVFAVWAVFLGAVQTLTLVGVLDSGPPEPVVRTAPSGDSTPAPPASTRIAAARASGYTGIGGCAGCHQDIQRVYQHTHHTSILGPATDIRPELLDQWARLPDPHGNPVVFDEDDPSGIAGERDLELADGTSLAGIAAVFVDHDGDRLFTASFRDAAGQVRHEQSVALYHIGARYRQALAVNLGDGAGTRLLKYQYSFDDGAHQYTWRDRNQARIYEMNCIGCHTSGFDLAAFEADRNQPIERFTADLGVGCESCHGPGRAHAASPRVAGLIVDPARLSKDQQVHLCAQCHSRGRSASHEGRQDSIDFRPGDNLLDHFHPMPVAWGEGTARVAADGKAAASRQQFMDHYVGTKASLTCTACHIMHGPDSHGALLRGNLLQSCAGCHGDAAYPNLDAVRAAMDGSRGWEEDPAWRGWRTQHTFRLDEQRRLIGLPQSEWPEHGGWPWDGPDWAWDFAR
jgi:hypothetical protein